MVTASFRSWIVLAVPIKTFCILTVKARIDVGRHRLSAALTSNFLSTNVYVGKKIGISLAQHLVQINLRALAHFSTCSWWNKRVVVKQ